MKRYGLALVSVAAMVMAAGAPLGRPAHAAMMSPGSIRVLSPQPGAVVTGNAVPVKLAVKDFKVNCATAGTAPKPGVGHWHLHLDGGLVNMYCSTAAVLSMQNVTPGTHSIEAVLAANNHMELMGKGQMAKTTFVYRPAHPLPALTPYKAPGKPSITILAPKNGATVGEHFWVTLNWTNFRPSCDLLGKPDVAGYGHWHLFWDTMHGPMMGMATIVDMGCAHSEVVFTDGLKPGRHTLIAALTDNLHAPLMSAEAASITINVQPNAM
jgi:hypothetical protein